MAEITKHALRVYSSIAALRGQDGDVIDALIPFFQPILHVMNGKVFDPRLLVLGAEKMYKWRVTKEVVEQFVPRFQEKKLLKRVSDGRSSTYVVTCPPLPDDTDSKNLAATFEKVIDEFAKFPPIVTDLLNYSRSRDELADILIRFLVNSNVLFQSSSSKIEATTAELDALPDGG